MVAPPIMDRGPDAGPLSYPQLGLWLAEQVDGAAGLTIWSRVEVGDAGLEQVSAALAAVATRHGPLRTVLVEDEKGVRQQVRPTVEPELRISRDPQTLDPFLAEPFDPTDRPPWRALLLERGGAAELYLAAHHLIFDDVSKQRWAAEILLELDRALPAQPEIDYLDATAWQRHAYDPGPDELWTAWSARLAGTDDRSPPGRAQRSRRPARYDIVPLALTTDARARLSPANPWRVSPFAVACAATALALGGRPALGTVVEGRDLIELRGLIGCFTDVGILAPQSEPTGDLRTDAAAWTEAAEFLLDHPVPYVRLLEVLDPPRRRQRLPLVSAGVQLMYAASAGDRTGGGRPGLGTGRIPRTPFGVELNLVVGADRTVRGDLLFRADWHDPAQMERLASRIASILDRAGSTAITTSDSRRSAVRPTGPTAGAADVFAGSAQLSVLGRVDGWADAEPARPAVVADGIELDYGTLRSRALNVAARLAQAGVVTGDRVALRLDRDEHLLPAMLGTWAAGASIVPVDPELPARRAERMCSVAGVRAVLSRAAAPEGVAAPVIDPAPGAGAAATRGRLDRDDLPDEAYVMFTSGSSGLPKGVRVGHPSLLATLVAVDDTVGLDRDAIMLAVTSISFDISLVELLGPLLVGGTVVVAQRRLVSAAEELVDLATASAATHLQATPALWRLIEAADRDTLQLVVMCGGEALPHDLARDLCRGGRTVWNLYGPTEATIWVAADPVSESTPPRIGRPLPTADFSVVDPDFTVGDTGGRAVASGQEGELLIGGPCLALGYLDQAQTDERFVVVDGRRRYRTGDLVRALPDGTHAFLGRADSQVKIRGFRVELTEVEAALRAHPGIRDAGVVHDRDAERLVAMVVLDQRTGKPPAGEPPAGAELTGAELTGAELTGAELTGAELTGAELTGAELTRAELTGAELTGAELTAELQRKLPSYMVPNAFFILDALPWTANAKLDRAALARAPRGRALSPGGGSGSRRMPDLDCPTTASERAVLDVCRAVLGVDRIDLDDDFFALGGHSLLVVQLVGLIQRDLGVRLPVRDVFAARSLRELAGRVDDLTASVPSPPRRPALVRQPRH